MKKEQKLVFGFVIIVMAIFALAGCDLFPKTEFPSEFLGTWKRSYQSVYTNTLTFTSDSIKDSTQSYYWNLESVSGNNYTIKSSNMGTTYTIFIKYDNGYLNFGVDNTSGEHDWQGLWEKK